jgi:hypothetical protein
MEVVYATTTTQVTTPDGGRYDVRATEYWWAGDPVVKAAPPGLFTRDPVGMKSTVQPPPDPPVEQATAAPGERRNVRRG